jgi:hypothetical protein
MDVAFRPSNSILWEYLYDKDRHSGYYNKMTKHTICNPQFVSLYNPHLEKEQQ